MRRAAQMVPVSYDGMGSVACARRAWLQVDRGTQSESSIGFGHLHDTVLVLQIATSIRAPLAHASS